MKKIQIISAVLLLSIIIYSCKKNAVQNIAEPVAGAQIKYFNFALNAPVINFYASGTKVTAASSTTGIESSTAGIAFSTVYPSTNAYTIITPGSYDFAAQRPSTLITDANIVIANIGKEVQDGKNYSIYLSGLYNTTTKKTDIFVVDDVLPAVDTSGAYVRLVHASYNANPLDLILKNTTTSVETSAASNVAYKAASTFTKVPQGVYDLILRYPGTATNVVIRTAVSLSKSNTYSFTLRGDITLPSTGTAVNRPFIDNTPNR